MSQASSRPNEEKPKSSQLPQEFVPKPIGDAISPRDPDIKLEAPPEMIQAQEVTPGLMKLESSPQVKQVPGLIKLEEGKQEPSLINLKAPPQVKQDVVRDVRPILTLDSSKEPPIVNIDEVAPSLSHDSLVFSLPQPDIESDDDGSELSRDSFEGNIVTNTPSPAIIRNDESSVASSSHGLNKSINPDKVHIISSKEEFIYEYERWQPFVQWGQTKPGHMLPSDPGM